MSMMNRPAMTTHPLASPDSVDSSCSKNKERNDNSNPQQGTGRAHSANAGTSQRTSTTPSYSRPSLKIPPTQKDDRKLFVGGLPANVTNEEFHSFFEQFGPVMDSIVLVDKTTNRSRGFGFVTFENVSTAKKLLAMGQPEGSCTANPTSGRLEMMGKMIEIKIAQPKESTRRFTSSAHRYEPRSFNGGNANQQHFSYPIGADPSAFGSQRQDYAYGHAYCPAAPTVFAGYVAPMYYRMPGYPDMSAAPDAVAPMMPYVMAEGYFPAYFAAPYGVPDMTTSQGPIPHPGQPSTEGQDNGQPKLAAP